MLTESIILNVINNHSNYSQQIPTNISSLDNNSDINPIESQHITYLNTATLTLQLNEHYYSTTLETDLNLTQSLPRHQDSLNPLLWLPYLIFTGALLGLICCSFCRFHYERGNQYRRRQEELNDKLLAIRQSSNVGRRLPTELTTDTLVDECRGNTSTTGRSDQQPNGHVPNHMNLFLRYSEVNSDDEFGPLHHSMHSQKAGTGERLRNTGMNKESGGQKESKTNYNQRPCASKSNSSDRHPVVYAFNSNGSMVDLRCDEEERTNTFNLQSFCKRTPEGRYDGPHSNTPHRPQVVSFERHLTEDKVYRRGFRTASRNRATCCDSPAAIVRDNRTPSGAVTASEVGRRVVVRDRTGQYVLHDDYEDCEEDSSEEDALLYPRR